MKRVNTISEVFDREYAEIYDYLYQDKDYRKECDFIEAIFKKFSCKVKTILDLGCGTGNHALILASRGYRVKGVDKSESMLKIAREKAVSGNFKEISFQKGDITSLALKESFDAVIAMFAVMSYQHSNSSLARACKVAFRHLKPGGVFIFDFWYGPAVLAQKPEPRVKEVLGAGKGERIIRWAEPVLNIADQTVLVKFRVWRLVDEHLKDETSESHLMRFLFPQEVKYFLETAGFRSVTFFPFLELDRDLSENDWNATVVAER